MTDRTMKAILAVVAVLAAAYGVTLLAGGSAEDGGGGDLARRLAATAEEGLDSVRIQRRGDALTLRRGEEGWGVDGHRADSADLADLRAALAGGGPMELASRNPDNHARMGVDSAGADRVLLVAGGGREPVILLVGDQGPYASSVYVRVPGTPEVYLARGDLPRLVRQGPEGWRERTLVRLDTARLAVLGVTRSGETYELRRGDGGWTVGGAPADTGRVRRLLSYLDGLAATGFAPDTAEPGPSDRTLTALSAGGDTLAALEMEQVGTETVPRFRVRVSGRPGLFELAGAAADRVTPARDELVAGRGEGAPGGGASGEPGGGG